MKRLLAALAICVSSCATLSELSSHLTKEEVYSVRDQARKRVLASGVLRGEQETVLVNNVEPHLSYYFLARRYADYSIQWVTPNSDRIVVYGRGDILKLEGAAVQRYPKNDT